MGLERERRRELLVRRVTEREEKVRVVAVMVRLLVERVYLMPLLALLWEDSYIQS